MINLLPPEKKRQIIAAQDNVILFKYCIASLALALLVGSLVIVGYITLRSLRIDAEKAISDSQTQTEAYSKTQTEANEFKQNLSIAKTILDKEILFTQATLSIARTIPEGVILEAPLTLSSESFGMPITLSARGKTIQHAIILKTALEQSSDIFTDVHLTSVDKLPEETVYPVSIIISVIINPEIAKPSTETSQTIPLGAPQNTGDTQP